MHIEILHRYTSAVLHAGEYRDKRAALLGAIESGADLSGANLSGANLTEANLSGADLTEADLTWSNLTEADLSRITLCGATIDGARVHQNSIGGPGHILYALTEAEAEMIRKGRGDV